MGETDAARYPWNGQMLTVKELAALPECKVDEALLRNRLNKNMALSRAMALPRNRKGSRAAGGWRRIDF